MTEWTQKHPIATHLINLAITVLLIAGTLFWAKYNYGDKIIETNEISKKIMDIVVKL